MIKRQIRRGVFETNSSSTHSITMCSEKEYEKFKNGESYINWDDSFVTKEEIIEDIRKEGCDFDNLSDEEKDNIIKKYMKDMELKDYNSYWGDEYLEGYVDSYTTKSGEKVIAFGKYGYEG